MPSDCENPAEAPAADTPPAPAPTEPAPSEPAPPPTADPAQTYIAADFAEGNSPLLCCRFDPAGRFVFAGAQDNSIRRWQLDGGKHTALVGGHDSWVRSLAFDASGELLISGGYDGRIIWWPVAAEQPTPLRIVERAHDGWLRAMATSPDGKLLATTGNDNLVKLWSTTDGRLLQVLTGHTGRVYSVAFHPSGGVLFTGDLKGFVKRWEISTGKETAQFDATPLWKYEGGQGVDFGGVRSLAVSGDGALVAAGGTTEASNPLGAVHKPIVIVFDAGTGEKKQTHRAKEGFDGSIWGLRFHPAGFTIAASGGGGGGKLLFFRTAEVNEFHKFDLPALARDMDLHPDLLQVAVPMHDAHLRIARMAPKPA
ncbi:MAG: WD40 repeat domain-containing protein [Pirellulales bacterium]|nr:WD40 repeat domain-containing protein [Pirellulales bacterium]